MLLILKICNNESGQKMPISDNVSYSVTMHTQKTAAMQNTMEQSILLHSLPTKLINNFTSF